MRIFTRQILLSLACLTAVGCTRYDRTRETVVHAYRHGDLEKASTGVEKLKKRYLPKGDYRESGEASWILLDEAMVQLTAGQSKQAASSFLLAIDAMDLYRQSNTAETTGQMLLDDRSRAYLAEPYEEVLARVYLALALWDEGDESNAYAMLRQAEEVQATFEHPVPAAKYLFALALARKGDSSNARIVAEQARELANFPPPPAGRQSVLIIACHNGSAPLKRSTLLPGSDVSGLLLEELLAGSGTAPAISTITGVPIPALDYDEYFESLPIVAQVDGGEHALLPGCRITEEAESALNAQLPGIAARAAARILIRRATVAAAKKADDDIGAITDLVALFANLATQADTRSWGTLPSSLDLTAVSVTPGEHSVSLHGPVSTLASCTINVAPGQIRVLHLFRPSPYTHAVVGADLPNTDRNNLETI